MVKCNIKLFTVLNLISMCKMPGVNRLQTLAACSLIDNNTFILPFSIPTHLFEDLRILNSIKVLREEEKILQQSIEILEKILLKSIERFDEAREMYDEASLWGDEEHRLDLFEFSEDCDKEVKKIQKLINESRDRKAQRDMEEELNLINLSDEYIGIQFKLKQGMLNVEYY
jgi:hypothetical protein